MKYLLIALALIPTAYAQEYVQGYTRSDGTHVSSYVRSHADGVEQNNYSYTPPTFPQPRRVEQETYTNPSSACGAHNMGCGAWKSGLGGHK